MHRLFQRDEKKSGVGKPFSLGTFFCDFQKIDDVSQALTFVLWEEEEEEVENRSQGCCHRIRKEEEKKTVPIRGTLDLT